MIIKELFAALETADAPVVRIFRKGKGFNVLAVGFKKGMVLKAHKTMVSTRIIISDGHVLYKEDAREYALVRYDDAEIPVDVIHSVEALEDSLIFLIQGESGQQ